MSLSAKIRRAPLRVVTGAYILNSGLGKLKIDEDAAKGIHGMASGTYGFLGKVDPKLFAKGLGAGEIALGAVVLAPFVSPVVAGAGVAGFSGALLNLYWNTPGMHPPGDPRPTQQGIGVSKDVWMFGIGLGLIADGLLEPAHDKKVEISAGRAGKKQGKQSRKQKKANKKARAAAAATAVEAARSAGHDLSRRAAKAADKAEKQARKSGKQARKSGKKAAKSVAASGLPAAAGELAPIVLDRVTSAARSAKDATRDAVDEYGPVVAVKAQQARATAKDYVDEYGPVVAKQAKAAVDVAKDYVDEYAPVVAKQAKAARDVAKDYTSEYAPVVADKVASGAKTARDAAKDYADEYGPTVAKQAAAAKLAAQAAAAQARTVAASARERVSS